MTDFSPIDQGDEIIPKKRHPIYGVIALLAAVALFLLSLQGYFYIIHPQPVDIPNLEEVSVFIHEEVFEPFSSHRPEEVKEVITEVRDTIKKIANYIAVQSCRKADRVCQSRALFYFVRDNIDYVPDERFHDQLENPLTVLKTGGADCEDMAVLLIALQKAIGNEVRLVFVPGHAYAQIRIPDYKGDNWINLEATCETCQFGELPNDTAIQKKTYHQI